MKPFSLLIKPASADCNLRCRYCFYLNHMDENRKTRMSSKTLEILVKSYMQTPQPQYTLAFQGGEPTLMGLPWFEKLIELEKKYAPPGASVANTVQTNGTLINREMAAFFARYNFLLGLSMDGPPALHDHFRQTAGGGPSHHLVDRGIKLLRDQGVEYNILVLVNSINVSHPDEIFDYFHQRGERHLQFIPCVEFEKDGISPLPWSLGPEAWGSFMVRIFDAWYKHRYEVSLRFFDSILNKLLVNRPTTCDMDRNCCQYFVVEYDGKVYPCDFFVQDHLCLGNIKTGNWNAFLRHKSYRRFGAEKLGFIKECHSCPYLNFCWGDCPKNRSGRNHKGLSRLCDGWKLFYAHALPRLRGLADEIRMKRQPMPYPQD